MQCDFPPYRADDVGSPLRLLPVKQARSKYGAGQLSAAELKVVEDAEIKKIIVKQEEIGLRSITDGELRRAYGHFDVLAGLDGVFAPRMKSGSSG
jgi:5-methyltetrahydropteroyltriglutamate--homocysteine methyltransferase